MRLFGLKIVIGAMVVVTACSGDNGATIRTVDRTLGPTLAAGEPCSASHLPTETEPRETLPEVVEELRLAIIEAAIRCDFEALEHLALSGSPTFDPSVDPGSDLVTHWSRLEATGEEPMRLLVGILRGTLVTIVRESEEYMFPSAAGFDVWEDVPESVRATLLDFYTSDDLAEFAAAEVYQGYRTAIDEEGRWLYFSRGG